MDGIRENSTEPTPDGTIARYLTVAGAAVDITYASHSGLIIAACTACPWTERTDTGGLVTDPPEKEDARIEEWLPISRDHAQAHAEKCRATPGLTVTQPWPDGVHTRYLTLGGAPIDVRGSHDHASYKCWGCGDSTALYGDRRTKELANGHAGNCRALPRPTG